MSDNNIQLNLSLKEAKILARAIASCLPQKEDEMITMLLYSRISKKIEEKESS